jgi:hypothetical protein
MTLEVVHVRVKLVSINDQVAHHEQRCAGEQYPACFFVKKTA